MRCFIAIPMPEEIVEAIDDIQTGLKGANWTTQDTLHLTLAFLGEQHRRSLEDLDSALIALDAPAFDMTLAGVDAFGGAKGARLAYAGVEENPALRALQAKIEQAAREAEIPLDSRRYVPHVTLARWGRGAVSAEALGAWISATTLFRAGPFPVKSYTLFRSELGRSGALHTPMAEYALRAPRIPNR